MEKGRIIFLNGVTSAGKTSIDGILVERDEITPHYQQLTEILKNNPLDLVEVYCPLDICRKRNIIRGDRYENQSDEQHELMAKNIEYKLSVDTSLHSAAECADIIIKNCFN